MPAKGYPLQAYRTVLQGRGPGLPREESDRQAVLETQASWMQAQMPWLGRLEERSMHQELRERKALLVGEGNQANKQDGTEIYVRNEEVEDMQEAALA